MLLRFAQSAAAIELSIIFGPVISALGDPVVNMSFNPYSSPNSGLPRKNPAIEREFKLRLFGPVEIGVGSFFGFTASIGFMFFINYRSINENTKSWIILASGLFFPVLLTIFSEWIDVYSLLILVLFIDVSCAIGSWILFKKYWEFGADPFPRYMSCLTGLCSFIFILVIAILIPHA